MVARFGRGSFSPSRGLNILAIPRTSLWDLPTSGFFPLTVEQFKMLRDWRECHPKAQMEQDRLFKQIIPYVVLEQRGQILVYQRLKQGGESRLLGKLSIGVGGHIDAEDLRDDDPFVAALTREVFLEELQVSTTKQPTIQAIGYINHDDPGDDGVHMVHLGVMIGISFPSDAEVSISVRPGEQNKLKLLGFRTAGELRKWVREDSFELWSQLIIEAFSTEQPHGILHDISGVTI